MAALDGRAAMVDEAEFMGLLDRLERAWERYDAPVLERLRPGLSDSEIDELMLPTELTLPIELRLWWGWHDSALPSEPDFDEGRQFAPGGWLHVPLYQAVALHDHHVGMYQDLVATGSTDLASLGWRPGLFPFTQRVSQPNHVIAAETLVGARDSASVVVTSEMGIERDVTADSVDEVLRIWVETLESGRYVLENGAWWSSDRSRPREPLLRWLI